MKFIVKILFLLVFISSSPSFVSASSQKEDAPFKGTNTFDSFFHSVHIYFAHFGSYIETNNTILKKKFGIQFKALEGFTTTKILGGETFHFSAPLKQIVNAKSCDIYGTGNRSTVKCVTPK